jgi:hypothetical protein
MVTTGGLRVVSAGPETARVANREMALAMLTEDLHEPDLSDYATAAILLRMALEARRAVNDRAAYELGEDEDLGTVAAQALLAAWGA